ncbi:MAG: Ribosomal subunit interface protein [Candidatus Nomurabacteria bacterium GW2011_GWC2_41_8]|uniref:Ribosomal subunit interface protein n=3 Tax=Candidatus Nomuraibacteriota TaxID=1752729 RepID=A0A1F6YBU3_9BACT|nr:MAG: Ribosomal subunit interface protein [Candidatus Nomurabacteria bacterium GW2011_GWA2_41_25]KKS23886.1 MAG: Ribosomal subunit interface protein [Candidatus Nomurabacteria bacterium GW2011_GWC2_41_8]OGI67538.1 MAG: ribosomal subunit interface protein [Candidatus Nomurabacteria bacterium RIFCSPHIGHO2_01_FULL_41_91]OGI81006.1 MAG: ribosomal subunit interface protein [Candidatus Nomurabacteria bacterium RIFCSPHIGHO2_02_FULL_41_52]OGI85178.1 MAG: ribosomal subunit interface protein [Candidatu
MQINLQGKNLELTGAIKDYVLKRVTNLEKLLSNIETEKGKAMVNFEVSKSTDHHKSGEIFHTDCLIKINGREFYGSADANDLYAAIDELKETLFNEIRKNKDRRQTLFKRGAASVKKMLKGLSRRNPFTSRY